MSPRPTPIPEPAEPVIVSRAAAPSGRSILHFEAVGFAVILAAIWVAEIIHLPHLLFDEPPRFILSRVALRSLLVLVIWAWVHFTTRRFLRRLHELEDYLRICSWCRKVGDQDQWLTMEEYFDSKLAKETSHGICAACATQQSAALRASRATRAPVVPAS